MADLMGGAVSNPGAREEWGKPSGTTVKASHLVKAFEGIKQQITLAGTKPEGMFGRVAIIKAGNVTLNSEELDFEFTVPFDDNMEMNETEIIAYNLAKTTVEALKYGTDITIIAGYKNDTGVIFEGDIVKVSTKREGVDKVTTIKAIDYKSGISNEMKEKTYKAGTKASYILKDLLDNWASLPVAVFEPRLDYTYKEEVTIDGMVWENIKKYAEVCGVSVYVNKKKIYARYLYEGDNTYFTVSDATGLIGSPEEFEEEVSTDGYKGVIRGYRFKMVLQHRMTTAAIVTLKSQNVSGLYRVRAGTHTFNDGEAVTEVEVI